MHTELLKVLRCPRSGEPLALESAESIGARVRDGWLVAKDGQHRYPIHNFIPRFVHDGNYADNFGLQWTTFPQTQLDSYSGQPISSERFWKATGWTPGDLAGKWLLDCGCGAGRFAEIALEAGARVVALDYSQAVDACYRNLSQHVNLHVVQGDIYALPFALNSFSYVYSLGVLQHTPDVGKAIAALPPMLASGGKLCVDCYERSWKSLLLPKYWLRPVTKRIPKEKLFTILQKWVPRLWPASVRAASIPLAGRILRQMIPIANYKEILPLSETQLLEWALLDTFDWLSPEYDHPQTAATLRRWLDQAGLEEIVVLRSGHLVGRGRRQVSG
jgi:2-polyprenyl-3-methyl-5-hydroxy-6-metoxy-1,4-benzoquinol methylase